MKTLIAKSRDKVLDLLTARFAYERASVKLYDKILAKMRATGNEDVLRMQRKMSELRDEEQEHEEWLEAQIKAAGGDAYAQSEMSRLEETETSGVERVVLEGDEPLPKMFHALLLAELGDNAGWDLLANLAAEAGDYEARRAIRKRLHEEEEHLLFVRRVVQRQARRDVLGQRVSMPSGMIL
jgi:bacterioferritin (cytochrome b1)